MKISIVIPLYVICERFFKDLDEYFKNLDYEDYEILIVCDTKVNLSVPKARLILTGETRTGPAEKRDLALKEAKGEILAFIDDDAYPRRDWLKNSLKYFTDEEVAAVGGPGLTPPEDGFWEKAGGAIYESIMGSGKFQYRFTPGVIRGVDDYPAYNLLVRKKVLLEIGGFGSKYYGGEDTKLCLAIINIGKKIIYAPDVIVFHHRRKLFKKHMQQVENVGLHRGYFAKVYPQTSLKFFYTIPSLFLILGALLLSVSVFFPKVMLLLGAIYFLFFITVFISFLLKNKHVAFCAVAAVGLVFHYAAYGFGFIKGFCSKELKR